MSQFRTGLKRGKNLRGSLAAPDLDLSRSMDCGQIFGWQRHDGAYLGIIGSAAIMLRQAVGRIDYVSDCPIPRARIVSYLGLDEDLEAIRRSIARDAFMKAVVGEVKGLRILKQDPWPCLCSYILSANNRVERIDKLVKEIASTFGKRRRVDGAEVFSLPGPGELAACAESGVRSCGVGFRAPYLLESASMIAHGDISLEAIGAMDLHEGREVLRKLPGVGDKVADCVLLFAFSRYDAFPVDVWIKRAMERVYFHSCDVSPEEIGRFARSYFGPYAGYAQEYIYAYARTFGLDW